MRIARCLAALVGVWTGCYGPSPPEGAPCKATEQCPTPQRCVLGNCSGHLLPGLDAPAADPPDAPPPVDAPPPPIDAMPLPCTTAGLSCGGTATTFLCGGNCWVRCTGNVSRETARGACAGWTGALGQIDDATENSCVTARLAADAWIGLVQSDAATVPGMGWTWNGVAPPVYTSWLPGKPDDGDGNESRAEQCAGIRTDGTWDDDSCSSALDFLCERP
jgi:hypothetical protein